MIIYHPETHTLSGQTEIEKKVVRALLFDPAWFDKRKGYHLSKVDSVEIDSKTYIFIYSEQKNIGWYTLHNDDIWDNQYFYLIERKFDEMPFEIVEHLKKHALKRKLG